MHHQTGCPENHRVVDFFNSGLAQAPERIWSLRRIETLNLAANSIDRLDDRLGALTGLRMLDLGHNKLTALPEAIGKLVGLRFLYAVTIRLRGFQTVFVTWLT
jgi:Leucine-rich repeat (LRR) protein